MDCIKSPNLGPTLGPKPLKGAPKATTVEARELEDDRPPAPKPSLRLKAAPKASP